MARRQEPLGADNQAALDLVADFLWLEGERWVRGLDLRRRLPGDDRDAKTQIIRDLTPTFLTLHGRDEDSYSLTPLGALQSSRAQGFAALAADLRAFIVNKFLEDKAFRDFSWSEIKSTVQLADRSLVDRDLDLVGFTLFCVGAWGGSGSSTANERTFVWGRPLQPRLEDILDIDNPERLFRRVQRALQEQDEAFKVWEEKAITAETSRRDAEAALEQTLAPHADPAVQVAEIQAAVERYKADAAKEVEAFKAQNALLIETVKVEGAKAVAAETKVVEVQAQAQRDVAATSAKTEGVKGRHAVLAAVLTGLGGAAIGRSALPRADAQLVAASGSPKPSTAPSEPLPAESSAILARLPSWAGQERLAFPRIGLGFVAPTSWRKDDLLMKAGGQISLERDYDPQDKSVAQGIQFAVLATQDNYVNDPQREVQNQLDVLQKIDPKASVVDVNLAGRNGKKFTYHQRTGQRLAYIERIWIPLKGRAKLQALVFSNIDRGRDEFLKEAALVLSSVVIDSDNLGW
jgi:hypothetical protein